MEKEKVFHCIGIMTGNSLDAADIVLTRFYPNGRMADLAFESIDILAQMGDDFRFLKEEMRKMDGDISGFIRQNTLFFQNLHDSYIKLAAKGVQNLLLKAPVGKEEIDAVGFHGQTCAHKPPSLCFSSLSLPKEENKTAADFFGNSTTVHSLEKSLKGCPNHPYTLQIGSGQMLADETGLPVVFDFRSDDMMNGGEGAPLAPLHTKHLAAGFKKPSLFINAGNTGNVSYIGEKDDILSGWDTGPFNHFLDKIARERLLQPYDKNGQTALKGKIVPGLLELLMQKSVQTPNGENALLLPPPRSFDPAWYKLPKDEAFQNASTEDLLRTLCFFSALLCALSLKEMNPLPAAILLSGGGWKNKVVRQDFENLLSGKIPEIDFLKKDPFFSTLPQRDFSVQTLDEVEISGQYTEARLMADCAKCFLTKEPFTFPKTTGCKTPTVLGKIVFPGSKDKQVYSRAAQIG